MGQSVKLNDELMDMIRSESLLQNRSVAGQIMHWIQIGRAIETSRHFDYQQVRDALEALISPDQLSEEEREVWRVGFADHMRNAGAEEKRFFQDRRQKGRGVGRDSSGALVHQSSES